MMEHKFRIEKRAFLKFVNYLEQIKGYNFDASKFKDYWEDYEAIISSALIKPKFTEKKEQEYVQPSFESSA